MTSSPEGRRTGMRFWLQSTVDLDRSPRYAKLLRAAFESGLDPEDTVEVLGMPSELWSGSVPSELEKSPRVYFEIMSTFFLDRVFAAERCGFDAFIQGSYSEPFLRESRSLVDIPVISQVETALLSAAAVAPKFGLVTTNKTLEWMQVNHVRNHKMGSRVVGVFRLQPEQDEDQLEQLFDDRGLFLDLFTQAARLAIERGADAIVPAHGQLAALVAAHNVVSLDGAAVINGAGMAALQAKASVRAFKKTGLHPGRRWGHEKPPAEALRHVSRRAQAIVDELGIGGWSDV